MYSMDNQQTDAPIAPDEPLPPIAATPAKPQRARLTNLTEMGEKKNRRTSHKKSSNKLHEGERIESTYRLTNMAKWTAFCAEHLTGDRYAQIARMCGKSKGWWAWIAKRQWNKVRPTPTEYRAIELLYKALTKFGGDTRGRRDLALKILVDMGTLQNDIAALMRTA